MNESLPSYVKDANDLKNMNPDELQLITVYKKDDGDFNHSSDKNNDQIGLMHNGILG